MIDVHCNLQSTIFVAFGLKCPVLSMYHSIVKVEEFRSSFEYFEHLLKNDVHNEINKEKRFVFFFLLIALALIITNELALEFEINNDRKALIYHAILASCNYPFPKSKLHPYPISELN